MRKGGTGRIVARFRFFFAIRLAPIFLPQGVFLDDDGKPVVPGVDREFIDRAENGHIFRHEDHWKKDGIHFPDENGKPLNQQWEDWLTEFEEIHGRPPNKNDVTNKRNGLRKKYKDIYAKGKKAKVSYPKWGRLKEEVIEKIRKMLIAKAKKALRSKAKKVAKRKGSKLIPGLGAIASVLTFGSDLYAGRPLGETIVDNGLDAVPGVGTVKGIYEIADAGIDIIWPGEPDIDEEELFDDVWEELEGEAFDK